MPFCTQCETYLSPDAATCPRCGTDRPPAPQPELAWTATLDAPPLGPPQIFGDVLLLPAQIGAPVGVDNQHSALHAFSLADGMPLWPAPLKFDYALISGLVGPPQDAETLALIATSGSHLLHGSGALLALDAAGQVRWRWPKKQDVRRVSAPVLTGEQVCITADAHTLALVDRVDGAERARMPLNVDASQCAPAVAGDVAYVPCRGPHLLAVDLSGGTIRWHLELETGAPVTTWLSQCPLLLGQRLFTATNTGTVVAVDAQDGTLAWQVPVGPAGKQLSPLATDGTRLFVGARDGLYALAPADGHTLWTYPTQRRITAAPVVVGDVVYVAGHDHHLYALDTDSGRKYWRHAVRRRIEHAPAVPPYQPGDEPWAVIIDRGGTLTVLRRPLSAAEHEAADAKVAAATACADLGRPAAGAALLERQGEAFKAAELWKAAGNLERAAKDFETAYAWSAAAELWRALDQPLKYAMALEKYARSLSDQACTDETRAQAWETAGQALMVEGERERAADCQRAVARWRCQPLIALEVQHKGLVLDAWTRIKFTVRNQGFGPARNLVIHASGDQFEGQVMVTREIAKLRAGKDRYDWLDVCPHAHGDSVPLRIQIEYQDRTRQNQMIEKTLYLPVALTQMTQGQGQTIDIDSAGETFVVPPEVIQLRHILLTRLSLDEFRTLCFELGVNYDHLGGESMPGRVRELLRYLCQRQTLTELTGWLERERPDIPL